MTIMNHTASGQVPAELPDQEERWEVAEFVAMIDPTIAPRLLERHPADGWCWRCRANAPCSTRLLAEATARAARRHARTRSGSSLLTAFRRAR